MAAELTALKMYWASSLTGMHDLAMRQVIDGADALISIGSNPTKVQVSHQASDTTESVRVLVNKKDTFQAKPAHAAE
jgi:hypothetical protein